MADLSPEQIVEKQIRRAQGAVDDFRRGVRNTKKNPMQRAIAKKGKMRQNILDAIDSGAWEEGLSTVSEAEWKEQTASKGGDNYARGVEASKSKLLDFQQQMKPFRDQVKQQLDEMPTDTFEQRMKKMEENAKLMHQFRFRRRRRGQ